MPTRCEPGDLTGYSTHMTSVIRPELLSPAIHWAREMEAHCIEQGKPLTLAQQADAREVGVVRPERVRVCLVESFPMPTQPALAIAAREIGILGSGTLGLTLGYGIFLHKSRSGSRSILRHELRHVAQCEAHGGTERFVVEYLEQITRFGYDRAPLEIDARQRELG